MRTDLVAPKNALMLFRVTKVLFSTEHIIFLLCIQKYSCIYRLFNRYSHNRIWQR